MSAKLPRTCCLAFGVTSRLERLQCLLEMLHAFGDIHIGKIERVERVANPNLVACQLAQCQRILRGAARFFGAAQAEMCP